MQKKTRDMIPAVLAVVLVVCIIFCSISFMLNGVNGANKNVPVTKVTLAQAAATANNSTNDNIYTAADIVNFFELNTNLTPAQETAAEASVEVQVKDGTIKVPYMTVNGHIVVNKDDFLTWFKSATKNKQNITIK